MTRLPNETTWVTSREPESNDKFAVPKPPGLIFEISKDQPASKTSDEYLSEKYAEHLRHMTNVGPGWKITIGNLPRKDAGMLVNHAHALSRLAGWFDKVPGHTPWDTQRVYKTKTNTQKNGLRSVTIWRLAEPIKRKNARKTK